VTHYDRLGLLWLESVGTSPASSADGSYAFAAVWFNFSAADFSTLAGNGGGVLASATGTLVWKREASWQISPCGAWFTPSSYSGSYAYWLRKEFTIDSTGFLTGGDLKDQWYGDRAESGLSPGADAVTGRGLLLEVTGQSALELAQKVGGVRAYNAVGKCGSSGALTVDVHWGLLSGSQTWGSTAEEHILGYDRTTPHEKPGAMSNGFAPGSGAIAQGWFRVESTWNACVNPARKSFVARSSMLVGPLRGPDILGKGSQGDPVPWSF